MHKHKQNFQVIRVLGGETRYEIVRNLTTSGPASVAVIASALGMTNSAVSHQLSVLLIRNILAREKHGTTVIYRLAKTPAGKLARAIMRL